MSGSGARGMSEELRERLANLCQRQWSGWMEHMLGKCTSNADGSVTISAEYATALRRQVDLSYAELSEKEKDSDRKEADRFLKVIGEEKCT